MHEHMSEPPPARPVVLVVDDDLDHATMLEVALEASGFEVVTAYSCRDAQEALSRRAVDAMVADLTLGDGTAIDVLQGAARRPRVSIVLTGMDSDEDVERTRAAGFSAHFVKPTSIDDLTDALREGLARRTSGFVVSANAPSTKRSVR
jgi:DNA-binding response OmpR family regulator